MNFGSNGPEKIITRANLKASLQAYEDVSVHPDRFRCHLNPLVFERNIACQQLCYLSQRAYHYV
jgi:hypothetical protein